MKVQNVNTTYFKGLNNPKLLKTLEFVGDNNAIISSGVALLSGGIVRPLVTLLTPETKKEDKEYIATKSISSALVGFGLTNMFFNPLSKSLKKIGDEPQKYLKESTIKALRGNSKTLKESPAFNFLEQGIKMSSEALSVVPKAVLTCALIAPLAKGIFDKDKKEKKDLAFKGLSDKVVSSIFDNKKIQEFAIKNKNSNINQHLMNAKDVIATLCFALATKQSKTIENKEKNPLIINSLLSTGITVGLGLGAKKVLDKPLDSFIDKFKKANPDVKNINKYINGIKVIEPILILSSIYYVLTPFISTFLTGKITPEAKENETK